ncbi:EAL domain-containing protein [Nodosilinea sp. LEGE 06152]|uniref:bifunctional diguanylate cyclase/phosphodiesterase n=1 Tax=Nodosilinea sp. LEGE 06152 TaxID=2777966 RepID=UPI001881004D|nr:EAL domain-containing protein [Nodosilinea sp. LEGE 06152]MBE9159651.1 EAL domain-containing protein [Nodosilinea sp. LEGE 06152]
MGHRFPTVPNRGALSHIPLRLLIVVPFVLQVSVAVGLAGWLSMRQGQRAVNQVASQLRDAVSHHIDYKLEQFLATSHLVNQLNYDAITLGQIDPTNEADLFRHFMRQSQRFGYIDSIFWGQANGEFVGHTILGQQAHQLMRGGPSLDNHIQFLEVDVATGQPAELVQSTPDWSTLTRPWYRAAVQAKGPVWGEIFPYHALPVLAISSSRPVYDDSGKLLGVLGNNFFLTHISRFLREMPISEHGQAFIMERSGLLVATSTIAPYKVVDGRPQRSYAVTSSDPLIRASAQLLLNQSGGDGRRIQPQQTEFKLDRKRQFMQVATVSDDYGLDWLIVVLMPEDDFMAQIQASRRNTIALCALALAGAIASGLYTSRWITRPLNAFSSASQAIADGHLNQEIGPTGMQELEGLAQAFNSMAARLEASFSDLQRSKADVERANAEIQQQAALFRLMAENMSDLVCLHSLDGTYLYVSPSAQWLLGYTPESLMGLHPCTLVHPDDLSECQRYLHPPAEGQPLTLQPVVCRMRHRQGYYIWLETFTRPIVDAAGAVVQLQTASRDVTDQVRMRRQLEHDACHDSLTGLPNRKQLQERLETALLHAQSDSSYRFALLFLDIDHFKVVNDSLGHLIGDELLMEVASRLMAVLRSTDLAVRLGGDEFVVLLEDIDSFDQAQAIAEQILEMLRQPFQLSSHQMFATVSLGLVMGAAHYQSASDLIRDADTAMYRAKAGGRDGYQVFDRGMHDRAIARLTLETELRRALLNHPEEFVLYYQPIIDLQTAEVRGFEALVRWQHPQRGLVMPGEFISVAEETGLIVPLSYRLLELACSQMAAWQRTYSQALGLTVSVNLSALQLHSNGLLERVDEVLHNANLSPRSLVLEITESMLIDNIDDTITVLNGLRQRGIALSIDDFGTGYSSLSYLYRFPITSLKIDRSFVSQMETSLSHEKIVHTIINLGRQLGFRAIAEGIETSEQVSALKRLGCDCGQGYWFGRPQPAAEVDSWLAQATTYYRPHPVA